MTAPSATSAPIAGLSGLWRDARFLGNQMCGLRDAITAQGAQIQASGPLSAHRTRSYSCHPSHRPAKGWRADCGQATFIPTEGCRKCYACGYSEC